MKKIIIATNNKGKVKEIKQILSDYELLTLKDLNCDIEVEEDKETFEGNSLKKAKVISEATNMPCIADDSGLCIDEFDGWPGVYTARFLGENATQEERNNAILEKMKRGNNGFGFDPIFELEDGRTYAELTDEEKNLISHRKKAIENLKNQLTNI